MDQSSNLALNIKDKTTLNHTFLDFCPLIHSHHQYKTLRNVVADADGCAGYGAKRLKLKNTISGSNSFRGRATVWDFIFFCEYKDLTVD
jgi:hypothetical protein